MKTLSIQRPRPLDRNPDPGRHQCAGERGTGELAALVGVEETRLSERLSQKVCAITND
jgi:hypothetical protein